MESNSPESELFPSVKFLLFQTHPAALEMRAASAPVQRAARRKAREMRRGKRAPILLSIFIEPDSKIIRKFPFSAPLPCAMESFTTKRSFIAA